MNFSFPMRFVSNRTQSMDRVRWEAVTQISISNTSSQSQEVPSRGLFSGLMEGPQLLWIVPSLIRIEQVCPRKKSY